MGDDGGSIPKRIELVKEKQKERLLKAPVVACTLGKLYKRDAVLEYLLNRSAELNGCVNGAQKTRLNLTPNTAFKKSSAKQTLKEVPSEACIQQEAKAKDKKEKKKNKSEQGKATLND
ncbi:hypothetical protein C2G38_2184788 [Gigaspora rosea]|uniref:Uncharacterized protein n=1 Tax=Gigaspora rosea TaxID=44941 RepID=A0A397V7I3_9GLOM|nr:hypothetical protein C2G38_2184788 [Gigaspora rosea]